METILYVEYIYNVTLVEFDEETDMEIAMELTRTTPVSDESDSIARGSGETPAIKAQLVEI